MIDLKKCVRDIPGFPKEGIIFKDITPLFNEQCVSICSEWNGEWIFNKFSFIDNPEEIVKKNPKTDAELKKIIGIGEAKLKDFGKDIIKMVNSIS